MPLPQLDDRDCPDPCAGPCSGCPDRVVCRCLKVTEAVIVEAIAGGVRTLQELRRATEAGTGCNCCHRELREYLAVHSSSSPSNICSAR